MKIGEVLGKRKLEGVFDRYVTVVLPDHFKLMPEKRVAVKGSRRSSRRATKSYKIVKALPTLDEYLALKRTKYTQPVQDLATDAFSEIESLATELRDWYDNLPDGLKDSREDVDSAASTLESISEPDYPEALKDITATYYPDLHLNSRTDRAAEAANMLRAVAEAVNEGAVEHGDKDGELSSFASECENACDEVESCEFPGMYG